MEENTQTNPVPFSKPASFEEDILKNQQPEPEKLLSFGFHRQDDALVYSAPLMDNRFVYSIRIKGNDVATAMTDEDNQVYELYKNTSVSARNLDQLRKAAEDLLQKIVQSCFKPDPFQNEQTTNLVNWMESTFQAAPEFLWRRYPDYAVFRAPNEKWFALLMGVPADKLGLKGKDRLEVLDVRMDPEKVKSRINNETILPAYHMNKRTWISIVLDGSVDTQLLQDWIRQSYQKALKS